MAGMWKRKDKPGQPADVEEYDDSVINPTDDNSMRAFSRSMKMDDANLFDWIEGSINGVHAAIDSYRYRGAPIEEVESCLSQLVGCVATLRARDQQST